MREVTIRHTRDHPFKKREEGKKGCGLMLPNGTECRRGKNHMDHVGTPKSLNVHGSGANRFTFQTMKQNWAERLTELLEEAELEKGLAAVYVEGTMCFPTKASRDQGNFRFLLEKALGDALKEGGWIEDDDWHHYEFGRLRWAYEKGVSWTEVTVSEVAPGGPAR